MIPIVGYNERAEDFPTSSAEMLAPDTPELRQRYVHLLGATSARYIGRGFNNGHHALAMPFESDVVIRRALFRVPAFERRLRREFAVLQYLAEQGYPHAPKPVRFLEQLDSPAFAMRLVAGDKRLTPARIRQLGVAVRLLHRLPPPPWLVAEGPTDPETILLAMCAQWPGKFESLRETFDDDHARRLSSLIDELPTRLSRIDWSDAAAVFLHGDLGDHNLLFGTSVVLLDWEFASVSHPLLDVMWLFNRDGFGERERDAFMAGYGHPLPEAWRAAMPLLCALGTVEAALWAQSGIADLEARRNPGYFCPTDLPVFTRNVERVFEIDLPALREVVRA